jgi:hypothetical protein
MLNIQVNALRKAYREFQQEGKIKDLLDAVGDLRNKFGEASSVSREGQNGPKRELAREDLRLICFDVISS